MSRAAGSQAAGSQARIDRSSWKACHEDNRQRVNRAASSCQGQASSFLGTGQYCPLALRTRHSSPTPSLSLLRPSVQVRLGLTESMVLELPLVSFTLSLPSWNFRDSGSSAHSSHPHGTPLSQAWSDWVLCLVTALDPGAVSCWLWGSSWYLCCCGLPPTWTRCGDSPGRAHDVVGDPEADSVWVGRCR